MRLAVQAPLTAPDVGGGYTFERELFDALLRACMARAINPVLVVQTLEHVREAYENIILEDRPASTSGARAIVRRIGDAFPITRDVWRRLRPVRERRPVELVAEKLRSLGVQFLVHLGPTPLCHDVPFSTIVWDLEHRNAPYFPELSERGEWHRRERMYGQSLPRATLVVTGTTVGCEEVEFYYRVRRDRILLLPHPTPADAIAIAEAPARRRPGWMPHDHPVLLYPAQFWAHKNQATLVRALARLRDAYGLSFHLVLPGSDKGNLAHVKKLVSQHQLESWVHTPGFVPRDELLTAYRFAAALVYPSFLGPENLPPLEAFALGCPVIAADIPGAREQLGDSALLVDPSDSIAIAAGIERVAADEHLRATLIDRGRARALTRSTDEFAGRLLDAVMPFERIRQCWGM